MTASWSPNPELVAYVEDLRSRTLGVYRIDDRRVVADSTGEWARAEGGYAHRQMVELLQNAIDGLDGPGGRVEVVVTDKRVYCANTGLAFTKGGIDGITSEYQGTKAHDDSKIGQFGLGFRSLVALSSSVDIFSNSVSFGFDLERNRQDIVALDLALDTGVIAGPHGVPLFRLPVVRDIATARETDTDLDRLAEWASTIVRFELHGDDARDDVLRQLEIADAQLLLFSPNLDRLSVRSDDLELEFAADRGQRPLVRLSDAKGVAEWRVFQRNGYRPTEAAKLDAGDLVRRETLDISWAVPSPAKGDGEIWLFFPTQWAMSLKGILNAAWKSDDSRQLLLDGTWNRELMSASAELVAKTLTKLSAGSAPWSALEVLPAPPSKRNLSAYERLKLGSMPDAYLRSSETRSATLDEFLTAEIYRHAPSREFVPDSTGVLRQPGALRRPPASIPPGGVEAWYASPACIASTWAHPGILKPSFRTKLEALGSPEAGSIDEWFDWMLEGGTVQSSIAALRVVDALQRDEAWIEKHDRLPSTLSTVACVLTADSEYFVPLDPHRLFVDSEESDTPKSMLVHPEVLADPVAASVLEAFGIRTAGALGNLVVFLDQGWPEEPARWRAFWKLASLTTTEEFETALSGRRDVMVMVMVAAQRFRPLREALLPGRILDATGDPGVAIDLEFHKDTKEHLALIGAVDRPEKGPAPSPNDRYEIDDFMGQQLRRAREQFYETPGTNGSRPRRGYDAVVTRPLVRPLWILAELSSVSATKFTKRVMEIAPVPPQWIVRHETTPDTYPSRGIPAPEVHVLFEHGMMKTSMGIRPLRFCVASGLSSAEHLLPVVEVDEASARAYGLAWSWPEVKAETFGLAFSALLASSPKLAVDLVVEAATHAANRPDQLPAKLGGEWALHDADQVVVACDPVSSAVVALGQPVLVVPGPEVAGQLCEAWELPDHSRTEESTVVAAFLLDCDPVAEPVRLAVWYPWLSEPIGSRNADLCIVACSRIETYSPGSEDNQRVARRSILHGTEWYFDSTQLKSEDDIASALLVDLGRPDLVQAIDGFRDHFEASFTYERIEAARDTEDDAMKFVILFGRAHLERELGHRLLAQLEAVTGGRLSSLQVAQALLAIRGDAILRPLAAKLNGIRSPKQFTGGKTAARFVSDLGLDNRYAGAPPRAEPNETIISGPPHLPKLHSFQEPLVQQVGELIAAGDRGILWLPTGAGKTRVAMEGLALSATEGTLGYPVLWVADRDELCEQAITALKSVWAVKGPSTELTVSRLWASRQITQCSGAQMVVATIQTLRTAINDPANSWLRDARCIVIDEAHHSITRSYEQLAVLAKGEGVSFLGLTATPFRGSDDSETSRLARRFEFRLIEAPELLPDPIAALRDLEILSAVKHLRIEGARLEVTDDELKHLNTFLDPSPDLERRLAADTERNRRLVETIMKLDPEWPVMVFALSVEHADFLAAALQSQGRESRSISAKTERFARRSIVRDFSEGKIKVLTNYQVFGEGFDAPKTRAIVIARPTYSPNLYQQMIGRGLRGPKQGGTDVCSIFDVDDNLIRFERKLAFTEFRKAFNTSDSAS